MGAYKRSPGLLRAYFSISIALIIVAFVFAIVTTVGSLNHHDHDEYSSDATSSGSYTSNSKFTHAKVFMRRFTSSESSDSNPSNPTSMDTSSQYESFSDYAVVALVLLALAVVVIGFILIYLKIYSLVLAFRLRKMILLAASTLPTTNPTTSSTPTDSTQVHEFAPSNTSCGVPQEAPLPPPPFPVQFQNPYMFSPGFAPYPYPMPMAPQNMQAGQQFPHQVMFGQQPVFYTYAPMPTVPTTPSEEKL